MQRGDNNNDAVLAKYMVELAIIISGAYRNLEGGKLKGVFRSPSHSGDVEAILKQLGAKSDAETLSNYGRIQYSQQATQPGWLPARNAGVLLDAFAVAVNNLKSKFKLQTNEDVVAHINANPGKHHYTRLLGIAVNEINKLTKRPCAEYLQQGDSAIFKAGNYKELAGIALRLNTDNLKQAHKDEYNRVPLTTQLVISRLDPAHRNEM